MGIRGTLSRFVGRRSNGSRWVFLSPHLDDVAFSCGGLIRSLVDAGQEVEVWTLFSGGPKGVLSPLARFFEEQWGIAGDPMAHRAGEDRASCGFLGAVPRHFGIPDAVYRLDPWGGWLYHTAELLTGPVLAPDWPLATRLGQTLRRALPTGATVVAPLALGNHVDHQVTRMAAEASGLPLVYYADYPYDATRADMLRTIEAAGWKRRPALFAESDLRAWCDGATAHASQLGSSWKERGEMEEAIRAFAGSGAAALRDPPGPETAWGEGISFCVISNGRRPEKLRALADSILAQGIPDFEILVCGVADGDGPWRLIPEEEAAAAGKISLLRNRTASEARFPRLVFCDDDMLLHEGWHRAVAEALRAADLVTGRILNPDGTRYWDWTAWGLRGQRLLAYGKADPCLYLTGGLLAVSAAAWRRVLWNEHLPVGRGEDLDFSHRAINAGFRIGRCDGAVATHDDWRFSQVGNQVAVRTADGVERIRDGRLLALPTAVLTELALRKTARRQTADAADCLRALVLRGEGREPRRLLRELMRKNGGAVEGNEGWRPGNGSA